MKVAGEPIENRLRTAGLPPLARLTWLEVDLTALIANVQTIRSILPSGSLLTAVVKADGYGHGLLAAGHAALSGGSDVLAVATLDEALELRRSGFTARVLILYAVPGDMIADAAAAGIDVVAMDDDSVEDICRYLRRPGPTAGSPKVHLGIETGMTRGGVLAGGVVDAARRLLAAGLPALAGTWSHLASPEHADARQRQISSFASAVEALHAAGIDPGLRHLYATGGLLNESNPSWDMARVGLAFYGHIPRDVAVSADRAATLARLRPALTLKARPVSIETVAPGTAVGYGGTWTASRVSKIATLGVGYADGWTRLYAGARASVRGETIPLVGRVSSDAVAVDVTDVDGFDAAAEVTLLAPSGGANTVEELADMRGSIPWEVLDGFAPRLARVYLDDGRPVAVRYLDGRLVQAPGFELATGGTATNTGRDHA